MDNLFLEKIFNRISAFMLDHEMDIAVNGGKSVGVALSGGPDSMALLAICMKMGWKTMALHCNFNLRDSESMRDEQFVRDICTKFNIPLQVKSFNILNNPKYAGQSIEMACREARYDWFREMAHEYHLSAILLGHHSDDNCETFLLNALRGTGIAGLQGMPYKRDIFLRPLLCVSRSEILTLLQAFNIPYITDSTNHSDRFRRNFIRNQVIPLIETKFKEARSTLSNTCSNIADDFALFSSLIHEKRSIYIDSSGIIDIEAIFANEPQPESLLYHLLDGSIDRPRISMLARQRGNSGKTYHTSSGRFYLLNRGKLIPQTAPFDAHAHRPVSIDLNHIALSPASTIITPPEHHLRISARLIPKSEFAPSHDTHKAWFDAHRLLQASSLVIDTPRQGDRMHPFGMKGTKLLSDILTDHKLSTLQKASQPVVRCSEGILWLPGIRASHLFPVTETTQNIIELVASYIQENC